MKYFNATLSNSSLSLLHNGKTHNLILTRTRKQSKYRSTCLKRELQNVQYFLSTPAFQRFVLFFFSVYSESIYVSLFSVLFQTLVRGKHKSVFLVTENKFRLLLSGQVDRISCPDFFSIVKTINAAFFLLKLFFVSWHVSFA